MTGQALARSPLPPAARFELVAIDLDGTLVDTIGDLHAAVADMQRALGRPVPEEAATRARVGHGIERLVHRTLTGRAREDAPAGLFGPALEAFLAAYERTNGTRSTLYPGALHALDRLGALGVPVVIVTNKAGRFSRPLLDALGVSALVSGHVAGDDAPAKKPDPAPLLAAARLVGAAPARSLMVGDSVSDVRAARAAGFASACVPYGYNHGVAVGSMTGDDRPDALIESLAALEGAMDGLAAARGLAPAPGPAPDAGPDVRSGSGMGSGSDSAIDAPTLAAYRATDYLVHDADAPFTLRVDVPSADLAAAHARRGVACSAFVTACNPLGRPLGKIENARRHARLGRTLRERGAVPIEGLGRHPTNGWPAEPGWLVPGCGLAAARALGAECHQNAILWSGADAVARLVTLR